MPTITETITGMPEIIAAGAPANLLTQPLRTFFGAIGVAIQSKARMYASQRASDTGQLAGSIASFVDIAPIAHFVQIGSNLAIAPFMEFGTGPAGDADAPYAHKSKHFPPSKALIPWVRRKGLVSGVFSVTAGKHGIHKLIRRKKGPDIEKMEKSVAFLIARSIFRKGGLKARRFLRDAYRDSRADIDKALAQLAADIARRWGSGGK